MGTVGKTSFLQGRLSEPVLLLMRKRHPILVNSYIHANHWVNWQCLKGVQRFGTFAYGHLSRYVAFSYQGLLFWDGQRRGLVSESTGGWNSIRLPHQLFVFDECEYDDDPTTPKHSSGQVATCTFTMLWNNNALYYIIDLLRSSFAVDGDDDLFTKQDTTTLFLWAKTQVGNYGTVWCHCVTPPSGSLKKAVLRISFMQCYIIIIIHYCFIAGWMSRWQIVYEVVLEFLDCVFDEFWEACVSAPGISNQQAD